MISKIYFAHSFSKRDKYKNLYQDLKKYFLTKGINLYSFVFEFQEKIDNKSLMLNCLNQIESSDLILAEFSDESVGVGFELGYAKALGKKTSYLYKPGSPLEQTADGTVDYFIEYRNADDVINWFESNYFSENKYQTLNKVKRLRLLTRWVLFCHHMYSRKKKFIWHNHQ